MPATGRFLFILLILSLATPTGLAAADMEELIKQISEPSLDFERTVAVRDVAFEIGGGTLEVAEGVLVPAKTVAGRVVEMVFAGSATFLMKPPNEIEAKQLELFTQQSSLAAGIEKAVFVIGNAEVAETILDRPVTKLASETRTEVQALFQRWSTGAERHNLGADSAILRVVLEDPLYQTFFASLFQSEQLGDFYLFLDPSAYEQVILGKFVPFELDAREERDSERWLEKFQKAGRGIQLRLENIGTLDTWMQTSLRDDSGNAIPGSTNFEPDHYEIEATLDPKEYTMEGRTTIDLVAVHEGSRAAYLYLFADLVPESIKDGQDRELKWHRSGSNIHVILAEPVSKGQKIQIAVNYRGVIFNGYGKVFSVRSTEGWYPHAGTSARSTYKLTFRWPKTFDLVASGKVVRSSLEGKQRVETRVLDFPADEVSFEVGEFDLIEEQVGQVKVDIAIREDLTDKQARAQMVETVKKALSYYEETFGPYPLDFLTVSTIPRGFSQGFLGFVTLADSLLQLRSFGTVRGSDEDPASRMRIETIAHELAHQWWGNLVGWKSYRDQWLSEALADYSAVIYLKNRAERKSVYLAEHARDWKHALRQSTLDGKPVESLGPVVLGQRLNSSLSDRAYEAVVYQKGSLVFGMLGRVLGEDRLNQMLTEIVKAVNNRPIDTETFISSIEQMARVSLATFADQFIYGTGVPEIYYDFEFRAAGGDEWEVSGEVRQSVLARYTYDLSHEEGKWGVSRRREGDFPLSSWTLLVPFQVILDDGDDGKPGKGKKRYKTERGLGGTLKVSGPKTRFKFKIKEKPLDFWLDQRGETLAYSFCTSRRPKRTLRYMAEESPLEESEALYKKALEADMYAGEALEQTDVSKRELERSERLENAKIYFKLAELYLDLGRPENSWVALEKGEDLIKASEGRFWQGTRAALHSRHDLLRGEYKDTYKRLSRELYLYFPVEKGEGVSSAWRRAQWRSGRIGDAEDYAMLAVSAYETSHPDVAQLAAKYAEERGANMTPLNGLLLVKESGETE